MCRWNGASIWTQLLAATDVPVEMLGGLIITQIGVNAAGTKTLHEVSGDHFGGSHKLQKQFVIGLLQGEQGFDVLSGEQHNMIFPERVGMVKGKDPLVLEIYRNVQMAFQNFITIKITTGIGHFSSPHCSNSSTGSGRTRQLRRSPRLPA